MSSQEIPQDNETYLLREYWDQRFEQEEQYDWLMTYEILKPRIQNLLSPDSNILILGCGNSTLSDDLYNDGYKFITNVDFSQQVCQRMCQKHSDKIEMQWICMDITQLSFRENLFDICIEKATIDALITDRQDPYNPSQEIKRRIWNLSQGLKRSLKPGGQFLSISFDQPRFSKFYFQQDGLQWNIESVEIQETMFPYYLSFLSQNGL